MFRNIEKNLILKKQIEDDKKFLLSLYSSTREDELNMTMMAPLEKRRFFKSQFELRELDYSRKFSDAKFLIVYRKKVPIGRIIYNISDNIYLIDIAFVKKSRSKGFGILLIQILIENAKFLNKAFRLSVATNNIRAIRLYQKLGFEIINKDDLYYQMKR